MAIIIYTDEPDELLSAIKTAINDKKIRTWACAKDGRFTHTPEQWNEKAWLKPIVEEGKLRFVTKLPAGKEEYEDDVFGVYNGRFSEMLINHFRDDFTKIILK
jgi:hypothetical protein